MSISGKLFSKVIIKSQQFLVFFKNKSLFGKLIITGGVALGMLFAGILFLYLLVVSEILGDIPHREELRQVENPVASEVYSADSVLIGRYFIQERSDIRFDQIPSHVTDALLSTEDVRFYEVLDACCSKVCCYKMMPPVEEVR